MKNEQHYYPTDEASEFYIDEGCHIIEILNNEQYPDISISRARVEPHQSTEVHYLNKTVEIYYILQGSGKAIIDNKELPIKPGDLIHIPPDVDQHVINESDQDLLFLCICTPRWTPDIYKSKTN